MFAKMIMTLKNLANFAKKMIYKISCGRKSHLKKINDQYCDVEVLCNSQNYRQKKGF